MQTKTIDNSTEFSDNIFKVMEYYRLILLEIFENKITNHQPNQSIINVSEFSKSLIDASSKIMTKPELILDKQLMLTESYLNLIDNTLKKLNGEIVPSLFNSTNNDKRFKDDAWQESIFFDYVKQTYLMISNWSEEFINEFKNVDLDGRTNKKLQFFIKQIVDALSPTNFAFTNPKVVREIIDTKGENLVKGLENFLNDLKKSKNIFEISTNDQQAYRVGKNIAYTAGKIVYQNDLMQLIEYNPISKTNYEIPLLIVPPCINKFYILDLTKKNSFVYWLLEQGYKVFLISWVNPDARLRHKNFNDYMLEGPIEAMNQIKQITNQPQINALGYCIGGTLLTMALAYLKATKKNYINSATLLTTLTDFEDAGELSLFTTDEQITNIEKSMAEIGYFDGSNMSFTFNILRSNDMIWSYFVNNYLLGKEPMAFDLLYWNSDSSRLPEAMQSSYLRDFYKDNLLVKKNAIKVNDIGIDIKEIIVPSYVVGTIDDHIAPWKNVHKTARYLNNSKFVLSASGHIAGVVNHPDNQKYCYWESDDVALASNDWLQQATQHKGSWWNNWHDWQKQYAGKEIKSFISNKKAIELAPGSYVKQG